LPPLWRNEIDEGLAIFRHESVEIDEAPNPFGHAVGDTCHHGATRAMPDQNRAPQVLVFYDIYDIQDVVVQADLRVRQMRSFTEPRQRGRVDLAPSRAQQRNDLLPAPATMPGRVNQDDSE